MPIFKVMYYLQIHSEVSILISVLFFILILQWQPHLWVGYGKSPNPLCYCQCVIDKCYKRIQVCPTFYLHWDICYYLQSLWQNKRGTYTLISQCFQFVLGHVHSFLGAPASCGPQGDTLCGCCSPKGRERHSFPLPYWKHVSKDLMRQGLSKDLEWCRSWKW